MKRLILYLMVIMTMFWSCTSKQEKMENRMSEFIRVYEAKIIPLYKEYTLSDWEANVNGTDENWARREKASIAYHKFLYRQGGLCRA